MSLLDPDGALFLDDPLVADESLAEAMLDQLDAMLADSAAARRPSVGCPSPVVARPAHAYRLPPRVTLRGQLPLLVVLLGLLAGCGEPEHPCELMRCAPGQVCRDGLGCLAEDTGHDGQLHLFQAEQDHARCGAARTEAAATGGRCPRCWRD